MNFYIGNLINEIDLKSDNAELSDELVDYIYKHDKQNSYDLSKLYEIDPYDDVEIPEKDLPQIINICKYIIDTALLEGYEEQEEGTEMLRNLIEIAQAAIQKNMGLVSIGD